VPRFPGVATSATAIRAAVYSSLAERLAGHPGETFPLHVGDTWMEPPEGCRMENLTVAEYPGMHRYASPQGHPELLEAVAARVAERSGVPTEKTNVLIAAGATGALGAAVGALVEPGEEVLIPAPHWPLISGIVRAFHGRPVTVPYLDHFAGPADDAVAALEAASGERTVALYLNTPNNPSGRVLAPEVLEAMVRWASSKGLWIFADEVYEDYQYRGRHRYTRPLDPERVLAVHSFSKAYGMAGNRCGYVVGPEEVMAELRKISTHSFYSTPTASQLAALRVLRPAGDAWVARARDRYREAGERVASRLGVPPADGSTFLFFDVARHLDHRGLQGFLEDLADRGLLLAPGPSFGPYPTHVRLCFTALEPEAVERGVEILAERLGR